MFVSRRTLPLTGLDPLAVGLDHGSDLAEIRGRNCSREPGEAMPNGDLHRAALRFPGGADSLEAPGSPDRRRG